MRITKQDAAIFKHIVSIAHLDKMMFNLFQCRNRTRNCPAIISFDAAPASGKTTFVRKMANFINLTSGGRAVAHVLQTDEYLTGAHRLLTLEQLHDIDLNFACEPDYWYRIGDIEKALDAFVHLPENGELHLTGLYDYETGLNSRERTIIYPPGKTPFLLLEGVYALHKELERFPGCGVMLRRDEMQRNIQFFVRGLFRGRGPEARDILYYLFSRAFIKYLREQVDWFNVHCIVSLSKNHYPRLRKIEAVNPQRLLKKIADEIEAGIMMPPGLEI